MKKLLLSATALVALTGIASAADLPLRSAPPLVPVVAVPVFTWTGFYVGINAGYGFADRKSESYNTELGYIGTGNSGNEGGFVGGGQIGYNYQFGNWVVGLEADAQYADIFRKDSGLNAGPYAGYIVDSRDSGNFFGTVRGRLGFTVGERLLVYGTGGFAYGNVGMSGNRYAYGYDAAGIETSRDDLRTGYAAGGGIEYAFTPRLTGKIEGLYVNLGKANSYATGVGITDYGYATQTGSRSQDIDFGVIRAGLNYKFSAF